MSSSLHSIHLDQLNQQYFFITLFLNEYNVAYIYFLSVKKGKKKHPQDSTSVKGAFTSLIPLLTGSLSMSIYPSM